MKITIRDNRIGCTQDNYNHLFWSKVEIDYFHYDPYIAEYLGKRKDFYEAYLCDVDYKFDSDLKDDLEAAKSDERILLLIIDYAKFYGVEVDEAVVKRKEEISAIVPVLQQRYNEQIAQEQEQKSRERHWQFLKTHGCKTCKELRYDTDMPWCKALHEKLKEKNRPDYDNELVYHFINYEPFPSENCPYKVEQSEAKES